MNTEEGFARCQAEAAREKTEGSWIGKRQEERKKERREKGRENIALWTHLLIRCSHTADKWHMTQLTNHNTIECPTKNG